MPPQPSIPLLEGVSREGQVGHVEEPSDVVAVGNAMFGGPKTFIHAPHFEWCLGEHVQGHDKEARQRIVAIEELLHCFGYKTEA